MVVSFGQWWLVMTEEAKERTSDFETSATHSRMNLTGFHFDLNCP